MRRCATRVAGLGAGVVSLLATAAAADVVRDGSLGAAGPGTVATQIGPGGTTDFLINPSDGAYTPGSPNVFHSFSRFDLTSSQRAVYQGPSTIRNMITRVTGGPSSIDGAIVSEIPGANLFFLNPAGVLFGENAQVDITGSFHVSTADQLIFEGGDIFSADPMAASTLSVDDVAGFGFLDAPAPIQISGSQIELAIGENLALVGGDIEIRGNRTDGNPGLLDAPSGRVDIASLASAGEVYLDVDGEGTMELRNVTARGDVTIADNFRVSTSGIARNPFEVSTTRPARGSGPVNVFAHDLTIEDADILTLTVTDDDAGDVLLDLEGELAIRSVPGGLQSGVIAGTGLVISPPPSPLSRLVPAVPRPPGVDVFFFADFPGCVGVCGVIYPAEGAAGDVTVNARSVRLEDGGRITARSEWVGPAGTVTLNVADSIVMSGVDDQGARSGLAATADSSGAPGAIVINAPDATLEMSNRAAIVIQNGVFSPEDGTPGQITIDVASLDMSGDARIDSSTRGDGPGGDLSITARDSVTLSGRSGAEEFTGITTLSQPGSEGDAGSIRIETGRLSLANGAEIAARPADLEDAGGLGDAGSIELVVGDEIRLVDSSISTQSPGAAGGNIEAFFGRALLLESSAISASVTSGDESGGNVTLTSNPGSVVVLDNGQIVAQADAGAGGNIVIETSLLLNDPASVISASSNTGIDGTVVVRSPDGQLIDLTQDLDPPPLDASALLDEPCAARRPDGSNSLVVAQSDGVPIGVEAVLPAFLPDAVYAELGEPEAPTARVDERRLAARDGAFVAGSSGSCLN